MQQFRYYFLCLNSVILQNLQILEIHKSNSFNNPSWIKFADGRFECFGNFIGINYGFIYTLPIKLLDGWSGTASANGTSDIDYVEVTCHQMSNTSEIQFHAGSRDSSPSTSATVTFIVKGWWK